MIRTTGQLDPELLESAHQRLQNRSSNQLELSAQRDNNMDKLSGSRRQIMSRMIDKQSGTQIVMLEGEKTETASHQETEKRLEELKMLDPADRSHATSQDSNQSRENDAVNKINSEEQAETGIEQKQLEIEVDHEKKTFSLTARKVSPDVRMKSGAFSPQSQPPSSNTAYGASNGRKNSHQMNKFTPTELSVSAGRRQTTIKQITLENVELDTRNNNNTSAQQQSKSKTRSGFAGASAKPHMPAMMKRPSNPSASPTASKQPKGDETNTREPPLKITKIQMPAQSREPATSQVGKSRNKVQLKHSQHSGSDNSDSQNGNKTPSPQPDKSHLNVKLPQFMQSTMNESLRHCLGQPNQKEPTQAFSGGESARRSLRSSQEMAQAAKGSLPQMGDAGLRNSDQVETKFGSVAAPSVSGIPQQTHVTRSSNASHPEADQVAKLSASQQKKSIPLSKTQSTHSKPAEIEDQEVEDDDTPYGGINDTEFKNFLLLENQNHAEKTPQTVMEQDRTQRGSIKSRDDSRLVDLGLPSSGVHNVTFLHQNHHLAHFPYEQYYLGHDFFPPQSKTTTARNSTLESYQNKEKTYDLFIDTKKGKVGMQTSKVPTCTYKFLTERGPTLEGKSRSLKPKSKVKMAANPNLPLSHKDKTKYQNILTKYAEALEVQVILMKLWHLSHQCQDQLQKTHQTDTNKHQGSTNGPKSVWQHEAVKLISVKVLHQITASFSVALLLLLNSRDLLSRQSKGFAGIGRNVPLDLMEELQQNFQIHHVKLPLQKIQKQVLSEMKAAGKEDKQKILNKPICAFDEFKLLLLSVFGLNIVKIYQEEGWDADEILNDEDGLYPEPQGRKARKVESYALMNSILRYVFLILTSKLSTLKKDETRQDDPYKQKERIDMNKLGQMIDIALHEGKVSPSLRRQIDQITEIFNFAQHRELKIEAKPSLRAPNAPSYMEESLAKYRQPLLGKIYNRERLSYGVAKDPLKIQQTKSRTNASQKFSSLPAPRRAAQEGVAELCFSAQSAVMSPKAQSKKQGKDEKTEGFNHPDQYDDEITGIVKVNELLGRPGTSNDTRFKHSFVSLNSRLQRNVVSQRQKYRSNIQTRRNISLQQSRQKERSGFMLNHARDDHIGKLDDNVEADDMQLEMPEAQLAKLAAGHEGLSSARGSTEAFSRKMEVDIDPRPKSMNVSKRPQAKTFGKDPHQLNDMTTQFAEGQAQRPSTTKNYGKGIRHGMGLKANLRQSSQPEIQEIAQAPNVFQTVVNSPSTGTYAPKFKGSTVDIHSKVGSLRAADKAVYDRIKAQLNPSAAEQTQNFSRSRIQPQMPIPALRQVSGALTQELYGAKRFGEAQTVRVGEDDLTLDAYTGLYSGGEIDQQNKIANLVYAAKSGDPFDNIITINSDQFDFASDEMSESPSALTKYVHTLQMWSDQGKEELKSLKVVTRGRKSMKFRMHNTMTGEIGDGTMDQRGINYGDVLRLYPQQNRGTARHSQGQPSHHKVDKSQKSPKLNQRLVNESPDFLVSGTTEYGSNGGQQLLENEQARRLAEYQKHQKQRAAMFKLKKDSLKADSSQNPPTTIGSKIKISQLPMNKVRVNPANSNPYEQAQKTTGRFVEVKPERPGKTPPLPSVDVADSLGVSTNRLKPSDTSDISLHAKVSRPRMQNPRPLHTRNTNPIDVVASKNELSGSPGTVLMPKHGMQYKKQSTLLLKKTNSTGGNDTEPAV